MNKQDLVKAMVERMPEGTTQKLCETAINAFIDTVTEALSKHEDVVLTGFGSFRVAKREERTGRNPKTGDTMTIPAIYVPQFRPGKNLREVVNKK